MEYSLEQPNLYSFETPTQSLIPPLNNLKKEMAAYASLLGSTTPQETYNQVINEWENTGQSQFVDSVVNTIRVDENQQRQQAMISIIQDPNLPNEEKFGAIKFYNENKDILPSLRDKYVARVASTYENAPLDPDAFAKGFFDKEIAIEKQQAEINTTASNWDGSTWEAVKGFLLEVTPFLGTTIKGIQFSAALDTLKGEEDRPMIKKAWDVLVNGILQGSAAEEIRNHIKNLPTAEQRVDATKKVLRVVENLPGTDFNKWTFNMMALEGDMENWEKYLNNGIGLISAGFGVSAIAQLTGKATKSGFKGLQVSPKSVAGSTAAHNPILAGTMTGRALVDETGQVAAALGTINGHIVGSMLPKVDDEVTTAIGPEFNQAVHNVINALDEEGKAMLDLSARSGLLYTDEAKNTLNQLIHDKIASAESAALHLGKSTAQFSDFGVSGSAVFGKTTDAAFASYDEALAVARELGGELPEGVLTITKTDPQSGKLITVDRGIDKTSTGEYFLKYNYNKQLRPEDIVLFGPDAVKIKFDLFGRQSKLLSDVFTRIAKTGTIGGYLFAHHMLPKKATDVAFSSFDKAIRMEDQFLGYARQYIAKQSRESRKLVAQLLDEGEKFAEGSQIGKVFTWDEVVQRGVAQGMTLAKAEEMAKGYFVYRRLSDWMYTLLDREKSAEFARNGFKWFGSGSSRFVGKAIAEEEAVKIKAALNKLNDSVENLTKADIQALYKEGGALVRLGHHVRNGDNIIEYAKVDKAVDITDIKQGALPYIRGWVPRFYENNYFTVRTPKSLILNGEKITNPELLKNYRTTHYASDDLTSAERRALDLNQTDDTGIYGTKLDRLDVKTMLTIADTSRLGFIHNNIRGKTAVPGGTLTDPLEGLMKVIQSTSKTAAMSEFVTAAKTDFIRQYGNFLVNKGMFPGSLKDLQLPANATRGELEEFKNAQVVYNWLEGMMIMQRYDSALWKNAMYSIAEVGEKYGDWIAKTFRFLGDKYPIDTLRKMASTLFISMRPARQILLQPSQLMLLASIETSLLNPANAFRFARDIGALNLAHFYNNVGFRFMDKEFIETMGSKTMGLDRAEYVKQIEQLRSTGLLQSVDMNTLIDGLYTQHGKKLVTTTLEDVTNTTAGLAKGVTFNYGRAIGFDRGEQWNLIGSWIVARNRYQRMNPNVDIYSKQATEQITADAREISFSMTRPGSFNYQRNALTLPLQFMAAPHKSILNMTTSKLWTPAEKARLMASSFALYGSAGVGLLWVMDNLRKQHGTELTPDQWKLLEGGVLDWGINYTINALFDEKNEKTNIDLARTFSPSQTLPYTEFLMGLTEKPIQEIILGPSWNIIDPNKGRVARAIRDIAMINKRDPITNDNFKDSMYRAIEITSGGTDWMKYRLARNLHWTVTTNGALIDEQATAFEAIGSLLGMTPARTRIYFEANKFIDEEDKAIKDMAQKTNDSLLAVSRKYGDDPDATTELVKNINAWWNFEPDESMQKAYTKHFNDLVRKNTVSTEESLHQNIVNGAQFRSVEQNRQISNFLKSYGEEDAANRIKELIGEE